MKQGSRLLQVTGILMIIGGGIRVVLMVLALIGSLALGMFAAMLVFIALLAGLIGSVIQLIAGIMGAMYWQKPEKANTCITFGIIIIVLIALSNILNLINGSGIDFVSLLIGLVLPILYLVGAYQLKGMKNGPAAPQ